MTVVGRLLALDRRKAPAGDEADPEIVPRLAALPEDRVLDWFWGMSRDIRVDRLWLLLQLTYVVIQRPATWDTEAVRREHETQYGGTDTVKLTYRECFACSSRATLYAHHVIEVQHGGSNTWRNKVPLCFPCHQYLHPWLKEDERSRRRSGMESLGEIAAAPTVTHG